MIIKGIGVDIVANSRIHNIIQKGSPYLDRFLAKVLNQQEIATFHAKSHIQLQTQFLSSRWAYKEAIVKASGDRSLLFPHINLKKDHNGKPYIELTDQNIQKIYQNLMVKNIHVSISHDDNNSIGFVILEG